MAEQSPVPESETPDLRITYETKTGSKQRVSFVPESERRWLRVQEEKDLGAEEWRYVGSDLVTDVWMSGAWADGGSTER